MQDLKIATEEDIDLILSMCMKFTATTEYKDYISEEVIRQRIIDFVNPDNPRTIILLNGDKGLIAGIANQFLFGTSFMATEVAWWVEPEHRKSKVGVELIEAFEFWAKQIGCSLITMVSLDDNLGKYYESRGYRLFERAYMKEIN